ncbi:extracellular solute-binding protein [Streptomyces meridianus]|uniref:Extracellular solute-binding protein n=1 Tax=Streptomyces meridianus TaxID=2938945 RepID=A0ABT0X6D1_9ACTN|nr:extracellular solute-binding protein [Streptomyces meridianus]MCM2577247.1 extracellular solute-binding protein [Streptomyces meridianus]
MQRRYLGLAAAGVATVMAAALSGCGDTAATGDVTLRLVAADYGNSSENSSQKYWDRLAADFEAGHSGIDVDVKVYNWNEVDTRVADMVKHGNPPDMAQIGAYADYAAQDRLYSADELLSIPNQADFIPSLAEAGEVHRVQYGLPFVSSTRVLFYNKAHFAKAGITQPPRTWDELRDTAVALKRAGVPVPYGLPLGPEEPQAEALNWILGGGGGYTDKIGTYTIDSDENIRTFQWLRDEMVAKGLTNPHPAKTDRRDVFSAFTQGKVGMLNGHPTLMGMAEKNNVDYGMVPLPGRRGTSPATTGVADWMMAFKAGGHRAEVGKFLDFVYSKKNVLEFAEQYNLLPVTNSASEAMRGNRKNRSLWPFLEQLPSAEFYPVNKQSWAPVAKKLKLTIGKTVEQGGDPASVLAELQREADASENASPS